MPDEHPLTTALIAGFVSLVVSFLAPWAVHLVNPAGPRTKIVEVRGVTLRALPKNVRDQLNKNPNIRSSLLFAFGPNPFVAIPGQPQFKQCVGQSFLEDGLVDDECAQRFKNWAIQQKASNALFIANL